MQDESDFQWTTKAEAAFKQMKKLIAEPPTLTTPMEKEELIVYLVTAREAGIDIAKPFSEGPGKVKFLIVAIDFFTKSIEAKPVAKIMGEGIKARLDEKSNDWIEKVPHALWAHRTMIKSTNGDMSFSLTYGTEAVILVEISMPTLRTAEIDMVQNDDALEINLDLLKEKREQAAIRKARSRVKLEKYYNSKVCNTSFKLGDLVYRNNNASHAKDSRKLSPECEGPYEVT
nr:reverse transcriptase domain-containing protein [Tanacetum cinerariifolium]